MKTFVKNFIGKGKQVKGLQIVKVTVNFDKLEKFAYEFNGERYLSFEVAKMKDVDNFGREFTVYVSTREEVKDKTEKKEKKAPKTGKKQKETIDETEGLPF